MKKENSGIEAPPDPPTKLKFAPKPQKKQKNKTVPKKESEVVKEQQINEELLAKLRAAKVNDGLARGTIRKEKNAMPVEVAFGNSYGSRMRSSHNLTASSDASTIKLKKEYAEPWDYTSSYYPVSLPMRRPYSGDPNVLNEEEFGAELPDSTSLCWADPASDLGLTEESEDPRLIFFQLPPVPVPKVVVSAESSSLSSEVSSIKDLPAGFMGKLLVYRSGKVKLKLGDVLLDVSTGTKLTSARDLAVVNTTERQFCVLREIENYAVVTPEVPEIMKLESTSAELLLSEQ